MAEKGSKQDFERFQDKATQFFMRNHKKHDGYKPIRTLQMRESHGSYLNAAHAMIYKGDTRSALATLHKFKKLRMSVEYQALSKRFRHFFTKEELDACRNTLAGYGLIIKE